MVAAVPEEAGAAPHGDLWFFEPERQSAETKRALLEAYHAKCVSLGSGSRGGDYGPFMKRAIQEIGRRLTEEGGASQRE